jgi:hypothetical protein
MSISRRQAANIGRSNGWVGRDRELMSSGRHCPEQSARKIVPGNAVRRGRDQFVGFEHAAAVLGLEPLRLLNVVGRLLREGGGIQRRRQLDKASPADPWRKRDRFSFRA